MLLRLFLAFFIISSVFAADPLYEKEIRYAEDASPVVKQSAQALAEHLEKITGQTFSVKEAMPDTASDTIQLWTLKDAEGDWEDLTRQLDKTNPEAFIIDSSEDKPGLRIIGTTDTGVKHGVYRYLQDLGFVSLFPGEHWQIYPKRDNIRVQITKADAPVYLQRTFFGTGGFGPRLPLDPEGEIKKMATTWFDANLFGQAFYLGGHYGEAFVSKHKAEFEAHPEYRAMINGERVPMDKVSQINYGNKDLRKLYVEDRLEALEKSIEKDPTRPYSVSVDPADGGGHDESPESVALGSISDRVFGLANEVAKRVQEKFPGNYVNLYAYNLHSDVTTFPLEKNVIVSVIPYGFNNSKKLLGDDLLVGWKEKAKLIGLYDYWGIPDWSEGMPSVDYIHSIPRKLKFWTDNHVRFFNAESTTGAGSAGIALYLASKMLWDPTTDYQAELNTFYDKAFGPARVPMQRMLERWASGFTLHDNELALSFRDLSEAMKLAGNDAAVKARIEDYVTYVNYLHLLWEFKAAARDSGEWHRAVDDLQRYIWQIRKNGMVQTFRISQLLRNRWAKGDTELEEAWDYTKADAPGWATVPDYPTSAEIATMLKNGLENYPVRYEPAAVSNDYAALVPLHPVGKPSNTMLETPQRIYKGHTFVFQADRDGDLPIEFFLTLHEKSTTEALFTVKEADDNGKVVFHESYKLNGEWNTAHIPVKKGKNYYATFNGRVANYNFRFPDSLPLVFVKGILPNGWTQTKNWFYVPKGTTHFAVYIRGNPVADKTEVGLDGESGVEPILSKGGFSIYEVGAGEDGQVWTVSKYTSSWPIQLFNIPNNLAFSAETLMVPKEELEKK